MKYLLILLTLLSFNSFGQSCGNPSGSGYTIPVNGVIYWDTPTPDTACWYINRDEIATLYPSKTTLSDSCASIRASISGGSGVTSITAGTGLSGGTITTTGTISVTPPVMTLDSVGMAGARTADTIAYFDAIAGEGYELAATISGSVSVVGGQLLYAQVDDAGNVPNPISFYISGGSSTTPVTFTGTQQKGFFKTDIYPSTGRVYFIYQQTQGTANIHLTVKKVR